MYLRKLLALRKPHRWAGIEKMDHVKSWWGEEDSADDYVSVQVADWKFDVGRCVTHKSVHMPSLVTGRVMATNGWEFYNLRSYKDGDALKEITIFGEKLRHSSPGTTDCVGCLLAHRCPEVLHKASGNGINS